MADKCKIDLVVTFFLNFSHNPVPRQGPAVCPHHHMAGTGTMSGQALISPPLQYSSQISSKAKLRHYLRKDDVTNTIESFQYLSSPPQCDISATFDSLPDPVQQVFLRFSSLLFFISKTIQALVETETPLEWRCPHSEFQF